MYGKKDLPLGADEGGFLLAKSHFSSSCDPGRFHSFLPTEVVSGLWPRPPENLLVNVTNFAASREFVHVCPTGKDV